MTATERMLAGRYRLLEVVGHGGMAVVHRGHDDVLDRDVAIKLLRPAYATDEDFVARFRREARHAASLHHPNIVTIHDRGIDPDSGVDYIVMQFVDGPDLDRLLSEEGRLPLGQALRIGVETARALQMAHEHGIVHRDVKPGNILIDRDGTARVADFGIARAISENNTTTGVILASPQYASPEQVLGEPVTPGSDIYSLGVVLYDAITGQRPFDGPSPAAVALERLRIRPAPPSAVYHDLPPSVDRIILRALEREPGDRYTSAAEMGAELEEVRLRELGGIRRSGARVRGLIGDVATVAAGGAVASSGKTAAAGANGPLGAQQPERSSDDTVPIAIPAAAVVAAAGASAVAPDVAAAAEAQSLSPAVTPDVAPAGSTPDTAAAPDAAVAAGAEEPGVVLARYAAVPPGAVSAPIANTAPTPAPDTFDRSAAAPIAFAGAASAATTAAPAAGGDSVFADNAGMAPGTADLPMDSPRALSQRRRRRAAPLAVLALTLGALAAVLLGIGALSGFTFGSSGMAERSPSDDLSAIGVVPTPTATLSPPSPEPTPFQAPALPPIVATPSPTPTASPTATPTPTPEPTPPPTPKPTARPTPRPTPRPVVRATPRPTPRPTVRPTPTPAPVRAGATAPARDPAETVLRFYDLVEDHRFSEAARLWSPRMRSQYPPNGYIDGRFDATTRIDVNRISIRSMSLSRKTANVSVDLTEYRTSGAPRHFVGSWDLVLTSSGWLMDRPHF